MGEKQKCQQCGAELPANAPGGVCPKCIMQLGLPTGVDPEKPPAQDNQNAIPTSATPPRDFVPPKPEELAEKLSGLEILELLGQGGMGAVYKARQKQLDRIVALKILPTEISKDPAFAERFTREARSLARLNHPHIVNVYDFGQSQDLCYFIMEFVDGTDLRQVMRTDKLAPEQALAIVPQICEALQYAHEEGIVHRDIKPENIFLDKKGRVKIGDFGLAKILNRPATDFTLTQPQQRMGTPHYMAPEQIEGASKVDHRADIYSLGVVFYEMLTGELPLGRFDPPSRKVHVDVRLDDVVLHALEKEPARRYQHASEVKTDVEVISSHERHTPRSPEPAASPQFSRKALAGIACVPFLIFFLGMLSTPEGYNRFEGLLTPSGEDWGPWLFTLIVTVLGIAAPFATIILGAMALHDIRHSGGRVAGLPLALADVILLPLLVLDFAILIFFTGNQSPFDESQRSWTFPAAVLACILLDFLFARWCWRRVKRGVEVTSPYGRGPRGGFPRRTAAPGEETGRTPAHRVSDQWREDPVYEQDIEDAQQALRIPSIGIRITGLLDCLLLIVLLLMMFWTIVPGKEKAIGLYELALMIAFLTPGIVIFLGGLAMPKCKSHGLAVAAAILAMIPFHPAFLIGLPFGIWALMILNKPEIQRAFAKASEKPTDTSQPDGLHEETVVHPVAAPQPTPTKDQRAISPARLAVMGGFWLLVAVVIHLGQTVARTQPVMYSFLSRGGWYYPSSYHSIKLVCLVTALVCFMMLWFTSRKTLDAHHSLVAGRLAAAASTPFWFLGHLWLLAFVLLCLGRKVARTGPVRYHFFGIGGWLEPFTYNVILGVCLSASVLCFFWAWRQAKTQIAKLPSGQPI